MIVPVGGTWSEGDDAAWWRPSSVWVANLGNAGLELLDPLEPFEWSSKLAIDAGKDATWRTAGLALKWYCYSRESNADYREKLTLVAHSHGGQVVAEALRAGLRVKRIVTVGTPVRADMQDVWTLARPHITQDWTQVFTEEIVRPLDPSAQPYQELGSLPLGPGGFTREFFQATRNVKVDPPTTHHGLMSSGYPWNDLDLWRFLR